RHQGELGGQGRQRPRHVARRRDRHGAEEHGAVGRGGRRAEPVPRLPRLNGTAAGWSARGGLAARRPSTGPLPPARPPAPSARAARDVEALWAAFPAGMTAEQVDAVLALADNAKVRAALRARLLAEMSARQAGGAAAEPVNLLALYAHRLSTVAAAYPGLGQDVLGVVAGTGGWRLGGALLLVLACGTGAMLVVRRLLATRRERLAALPASARRRPTGRLLVRRGLLLLEIGAFPLGSFLAYAVLRPSHPAAPVILLAVLRAASFVLLADKIVRFLCDPDRPELRLVAADDALARALHGAIVAVIGLTAAIIALLQGLAALGLPRDDLAALMLPLSVVPNAYLPRLIWRRRG